MQWRIQDFPDRRGSLGFGAKTYQFLPKKGIEMKEIEPGGHILSTLLAPPMKCHAQPLDNCCFDLSMPQN